MSYQSVLIIDNNRNRSQSLKILLEFMDFKIETLSQLSNLDETSNDSSLIIFGDKNCSDFLAPLRELTSSAPQIPFILLENEQLLPIELFKQQFPLCLGVFQEPFKQDNFSALIADLITEKDAETIVNATAKTRANTTAKVKIKPVIDALEKCDYIEKHLIGQSQSIQRVKKLIKQVAQSNANVLILGESGTGKEVVAKCVHKLSKRYENAYVPVNCGAIPADLLESELFGHEKGAFTGAINARQGRFELAHAGTLFLDEIGDMPLPMQVKILRILQEKMFERVGGNKSIVADVRIIAATHRNLEERVADGSFREDLFYRLNVFPIEIPPLKDRVIDIPLLVDFLNQTIEEEKDERVHFSDQAMASIFMHPWPGNIRELANLVERLAIIFGSEPIEYDDLPEKYKNDISDFDFSQLENIPAAIEESHIDSKITGQQSKHQPIQQANSDNQNMADEEELATDTEKATTTKITHPLPDLDKDDAFNLKEHLGNLEQTLIEDALIKCNGVVAHAAKRLNIRRTTLVEKMRKYGI